MKTFIYSRMAGLFSITALFSFAVQAQTITFTDSWNEAGYTLNESSRSGATVNFSITEFTLDDIIIDGEAAKNILLPNHWLPNDEGAPNLPGSGRYLAIPDGATPVLNIVSMRKEVYQGLNIAPAPRIPWDTEDGPLDYNKNQEIYSENTFYPAHPVTLSTVSQIRGVDVVMLGITPFQYNPVTGELIVYRDIVAEVQFEGGNGTFGEERLRSRYWDQILNDVIFNQQALPPVDYSKRAASRASNGCEYLIIVPDGPEFLTWAEEIRMHRIKQGITTDIVTLAEIGGNSAPIIETYINDAYANWDPAPTAILLMADYGTNAANSITSPIWDNYCVSDNIYGDVDGDDMPDIVMARMTANNNAQLETMVTKFIEYEMNPPTNFNFYDNPITALGYQTERWFQICSESVAGYFEVVQGKNPTRINAIYSGNPQTGPWSTAQNTSTVLGVFGPNGLGYIPSTPGMVNCTWYGTNTDVTNAINSGAFILQHRDHGNVTLWGEPAYSNADINNLVNTDLTFVFSVNCLTGKYNHSSECFTEKFHRHTNNGVNSGALGLIAASETSYSFVNDTYVWGMYDNMWPDFMPQYGEMGVPERGMLPAFGNSAGKYFLQQSSWPYNTNNKEVTYNLFHHHGDAFLNLYSEVPQDLTILHDGVILAGLDQFTITTDQGATICLTVGDQIIGYDIGTGVPQVINITPQTVGTMVTLTIFKQNHFRHEEVFEVIPADGPYCIYSSHDINDDEGNGNGLADFNEIISLNFELKNVGLDDGENVTATLTTTDPYITFYDDSENFGTVISDSSVTIENAFRFFINDAVPDQHKVLFNCVATNGEETWESVLMINVNAPDLHINHLTIDDTEFGDGDGELDPGEQVEMTVNYSNTGHATAYNVGVSMEAQSGFAEVLNCNQSFASIGFFGVFEKTFDVILDEETPEGISIKFVNELTMSQFLLSRTFPEKVTPKCEDFETGNFSKFPWTFAGNEPWQVTNQYPYAGLFSGLSGAISDGQSSEMQVTYQVMTADSISFIKKTSSEPADKLKFYIGSTLMGEWSGSTGGWTKVSFPVGAGTKTFRWVYEKNGSTSSGADCAWIDNILFPPPVALTIWAGPDDAVCPGDIYSLEEAYGTAYNAVEWTTSGTGSFDNNTIINPAYTPSDDDITAGEVILTLTLTGSDGQVTDEMTLTFRDLPEAPPVPEGPDYIDLLYTTTSDYTTQGINGVTDYSWYIEPSNAGTIEGNGVMATVNWNSDYLGVAGVSVAAIDECGEGTQSEAFEVTVDNTVGIGEDPEALATITVAPNPGSDLFFIEGKNFSDPQTKLRVMNLLGAVVYEESLNTGKNFRIAVDLSSAPKGIYFLVLESRSHLVTKKIIKK